MNNIWTTFAVVVSAEPLQITKSGKFQYAALRISRKGGALGYTMGCLERVQRLPASLEPREMTVDDGFVVEPYIWPGALSSYAELFRVAAEREAAHKATAARCSVEDFKEQGRRPVRSSVPRRRVG